MDDKTKIKILKGLLGALVATTAFDIFVMWQQYKTIRELLNRLEVGQEALHDLGFYTKKILEVTDPTPGQIAEINKDFDFYKWQESLYKD